MRVNPSPWNTTATICPPGPSFTPGMNIICGDNAQGKTNLLEAVAYLSAARSHRARYDRELILFGVEHGFITGEISCRGRDYTVEIAPEHPGPAADHPQRGAPEEGRGAGGDPEHRALLPPRICI